MGVLTIRNVDDDLIVALKARARANHRSLEGELRHLLSRYAVPSAELGVVRERARIAAAYRAIPTAPATTVPDIPTRTADVRADDAEWMGAMRDMGAIVGDVIAPAAEPSDWDALRRRTSRPKEGD